MPHSKGQQQQKGFSLVELLIVVAIIGIIAAIAIPNLLASRRAANEASAIQTMRTLSSAQGTYATTFGGGIYGTMQQLSDRKLIDNAIMNATPTAPKSGYSFAITNPTGSGYVSGAAPALGTMGSRSFSSDEAGVIYAAAQTGSTPPTTTSGTPIGN